MVGNTPAGCQQRLRAGRNRPASAGLIRECTDDRQKLFFGPEFRRKWPEPGFGHGGDGDIVQNAVAGRALQFHTPERAVFPQDEFQPYISRVLRRSRIPCLINFSFQVRKIGTEPGIPCIRCCTRPLAAKTGMTR